MTHSLGELADILGTTVDGDAGVQISDIAEIETAEPQHISFIANGRARKHLHTTRAGALLVPEDLDVGGRTVLRVADPYAAFIQLVHVFRPEVPDVAPGIAKTAVIAPDAVVAEDAAIGNYVVIDTGSVIGAGSSIGTHVVIGRNVTIGRDVRIHARAVIRHDVTIGDRVMIQSGAVIGSIGFGYRKEGERYLPIPHRGRVVLEDDVEIGANATIDRGTIGETRIATGTKLDNMVHLAHNVKIGKHVVIAGQTGVSGSTCIEDRVAIGGQAGLVEHLTIAHDSVIGAQAGVTKSIKKPGSAVWGYPAKPLRDAKRIEIYLRRLPELFQQVEDLVKRLAGVGIPEKDLHARETTDD